MSQKTFILIGRSGCGKGTQGALISEYLNKNDANRKTLYIQTGSEYREFIKGDSETQKLSKNIYDVGGLQPEFLSVYMWVNVLVKNYIKEENIIFDGTPRRFHEAGVLDSIFDFYNIKDIYAINIEISEEESVKRLMSRGRIDDTKDEIKKRLSWYETDVVPAINFYRDNSRYKFLNINGERSPEEIHKEIIDKINL